MVARLRVGLAVVNARVLGISRGNLRHLSVRVSVGVIPYWSTWLWVVLWLRLGGLLHIVQIEASWRRDW